MSNRSYQTNGPFLDPIAKAGLVGPISSPFLNKTANSRPIPPEMDFSLHSRPAVVIRLAKVTHAIVLDAGYREYVGIEYEATDSAKWKRPRILETIRDELSPSII